MGRRFLTSAAIAAATLGVAAGPAFAKTEGPSFSNGLKLTRAQHALVNGRVKAAENASPNAGTAFVLDHGRLAECTVPEGGSNFANFFTRDTTNYIEFNGFELVGTCTADLNNKQTKATANDKPDGRGMIPTPGKYATYSEACTITFQGQAFVGDAESIVYKDGIFDETCIVPVI
jgi:hypothetical protein